MTKKTFKRGMVIALTAAMMTTSVSGVFTGTAATVFAKESARKMAASVRTKAETEIPKADILDLAFEGGKVQDRLNGKRELKTYGEPVISKDEQLGREVAVFDGNDDGFGYLLTPEDWQALGSHYSFECMVKEKSENVQGTYGTQIMGTAVSRNGALMAFKNGGIVFMGVKANKYTRDLSYKAEREKWVHVVGTYDGKELKLYVNGQKLQEFAGTEFGTGTGSGYFNIAAKGMIESSSCKIASAKVYSKVLSAEEIKTLYNREETTNITIPDDASFVTAKGDIYTVPDAAAQTATGTAAEVTTEVKDPEGNDVAMDANRQFTAAQQGEYRILYKANETIKEKTLRVAGEPGIEAQIRMTVDDQETMLIQNLDKDAYVNYKSAEPEIAAIDDQGIILAKKAGETVVSITVNQAGHTYSLVGKIVVTEKPSIIKEKLMTEGDSDRFVVEHTEAGANISYKSTAPQIVSVNETGVLLAKKAGTATIQTTVKQKGKIYTLKTKVTVKEKPSVIGEKIMTEGETGHLTVEHVEAGAKVMYTSTDSKVAAISTTGEILAKKAGLGEIRITVEQNGHIYHLHTMIMVKEKTNTANKPAPSVVIKPNINVQRKTVLVNHKFKINVSHRSAKSKISFRTGNKKIASVSKSGYVKGLRDGKTTILTTVHQSGKTFTFKTKVTVKGYVKFIKIKKTVKRGKSYTFKAKAYGTGKKIRWSVSNKKFAKISRKGRFTARKKKGKVYVILKSGKYTKKIRVKIK